MMLRTGLFILFFSFLVLLSCSHDKIGEPTAPTDYKNLNKVVYNMLNPILDNEHGYHFNQPADIYIGVDNFVYVCNTGANEIIMMDMGGGIQGISQAIPHPEAITQNDSLQLLVVNKTNKIFKIDLVAANHILGNAPVETVFEQASKPTRQFTGISVYNGFEYYVTVVDTADSSQSFVYEFYSNNIFKGEIREPSLTTNGTALSSVTAPTSIVSLREEYLDISSKENTIEFLFTQKGRTSQIENAYKFQYITTRSFEGDRILTANTSLIGSDIYATDKFWNLEDVAIDRNGYIFIVDAGKSSYEPGTTQYLPGFYRFVASSGKQLQAVLGFGSGPRMFNNPKGIAITPFVEDQIVYVADTGNNRIMMFQLSNQ